MDDSNKGRRCAEGKYCPKGTTVEKDCEKGSYNPNKGQGACIPCPAGKLCNTDGMAAFVDCPAGSYCPAGNLNGDANQSPCPAGTFSPSTNLRSADECLPCPPGKYCAEGSTAPTGDCAATFYCGGKGTVQQPSDSVYVMGTVHSSGTCPAGFYCQQEAGQCLEIMDGAGTCQVQPEMCTKEFMPVCGCDGQTYGNACEAAAAGVSVAVEGECASPDME